ncbi:RimK family alpha-L-glutamate ligase [Oryzibacter oryziterrae]|uniref:RimK family alpha-L-glutamate ligase n=1 Tax=Oryzibacter oryziterrae TaxID=2766474 RepID=UPI001F0042AE|nr:RimK family alpha-L-glutamate ligase [Oryzibacter oryziterrae]
MPHSNDTAPLLIFTDQADWHLRKLKAALTRRGLKPVVASLRDVAFDSALASGLAIPGLDGRLPATVMVRGIAAGSFEAITLRLGVLHELEARGIPVWNPPRAIERCVDKAATTAALVRRGIPTPLTLATENTERARDFVVRECAAGHEVVVKPLFGSQGKGIVRIARLEDLPEPEAVHGAYYLQRYIAPRDGLFRDFRVFVSAGRVVAGMIRASGTWITNVHQGGRPEALAVTAEVERLALAAAAAVGAAFAGVDLIVNSEGAFEVLEVNSMPAWTGLQKVAPCDVADVLVGDWLRETVPALAVEGTGRG